MPDKIRRTEVLKALDFKSNPDGSQVVYSIVFLKKNRILLFVTQLVSEIVEFIR